MLGRGQDAWFGTRSLAVWELATCGGPARGKRWRCGLCRRMESVASARPRSRIARACGRLRLLGVGFDVR